MTKPNTSKSPDQKRDYIACRDALIEFATATEEIAFQIDQYRSLHDGEVILMDGYEFDHQLPELAELARQWQDANITMSQADEILGRKDLRRYQNRYTVVKEKRTPEGGFDYRRYNALPESAFFSTGVEALANSGVTFYKREHQKATYYENTHIFLRRVVFPDCEAGYLVEDQRPSQSEIDDARAERKPVTAPASTTATDAPASQELKRAIFNLAQAFSTMNSLWEEENGPSLGEKYPFKEDFSETAAEVCDWASEYISTEEWQAFYADMTKATEAPIDATHPACTGLNFPGFDITALSESDRELYDQAMHCNDCAKRTTENLRRELFTQTDYLRDAEITVEKIMAENSMTPMNRELVTGAFSTPTTDARLRIASLTMLINQIDHKVKALQLPMKAWGDDLDV